METIKLKKRSVPRKRFVISERLNSLDTWFFDYESMKNLILTNSAFQLVGKKVVLEIDEKSNSSSILIEVVGVPSMDLITIDSASREVLIYEYPKSVFDVDFKEVRKVAKGLINSTLGLSETTYHIVFDGSHLSLHFFI
jgi:hypothetical protein